MPFEKTKIIILILLFISCGVRKKEPISCQKIAHGIMDDKLFKKVNGRLIFTMIDLDKMFKVVTPSTTYYVSDSIMKKTKGSVEKQKCKNIEIKKFYINRNDSIKVNRHFDGEY